jgi:hypothetical protein
MKKMKSWKNTAEKSAPGYVRKHENGMEIRKEAKETSHVRGK